MSEITRHAVTCRVEGCENEGYTLVLNNPGSLIVCGPCGVPITDIDPPLPDPGDVTELTG